ncbi:MAG: long-chain fatty acid--CoA ligase [Verrucomicrobiales bacterium]|nr:long-chain fatty acid--CoA ligase [Verrucomicrobiales bacterium]
MLEERWRNTVARFGSAVAVRDLGTGQSWSFRGLASAADAGSVPGTPWICPSGQTVGFLLSVLHAWRHGRLLIPLEPGLTPPAVPTPPPDTALLKQTSGTTGASRCIRFTGSQLAADADAIVATMGLRPERPNLGVISLAHSYGFSNLVLPLFLHGIPLYLAPSPLPAAISEALRASGGIPLTLPAVPALWSTWFEAGALSPAISLAISAGAPLPLPLEEAVFGRHGLKLHNFLGASECGGIAYDASPFPRRDSALAGKPLTGVSVTQDGEGCLRVRGPAVGEGYWPEPDPRLSAGTYCSQDRVDLDPEGAVHLRGRSGDVINVAGRKLQPETVESELLRHPAVRAALVLGLPRDAALGDLVAAVVQVEGPASDAELREFLLQRLHPWQVPKVWHRVPALEVNARGKISRAAWRGHLLAGSG